MHPACLRKAAENSGAGEAGLSGECADFTLLERHMLIDLTSFFHRYWQCVPVPESGFVDEEPPSEDSTETPSDPEPTQGCCRAMTAQCLSCVAGITEEEFCRWNADTAGCNPESDPEPTTVSFCFFRFEVFADIFSLFLSLL